MTDPRIPERERQQAQLPDDLDQTPGIGPLDHGSEDAQLIAGADRVEGDVERVVSAEPDPGPDDLAADGE